MLYPDVGNREVVDEAVVHRVGKHFWVVVVIVSVLTREGHLEPSDVVVAGEARRNVEHGHQGRLLLEPVEGGVGRVEAGEGRDVG